MIQGKKKQILYKNEEELRRSLRQLKAYNSPKDPFHKKAKVEISTMGSPLIQ